MAESPANPVVELMVEALSDACAYISVYKGKQFKMVPSDTRESTNVAIVYFTFFAFLRFYVS